MPRSSRADHAQSISVSPIDPVSASRPKNFYYAATSPSGGLPAQPASTSYVEQQRRFDAAVPSAAGVGQQIRLLAQVRFADSAPLGTEAWLASGPPEPLETASEAMHLRFALDPVTGEAQHLPLLIKLSTFGFDVSEPEQLIDVPADGFSPVISFLLEAREQGQIPIDVSIYSLEARPRCLGTARIDTRIGPVSPPDPPLATMSVAVRVDAAFATLQLQIDYSAGRHEVSLIFTPPNGRSESTLADDVPVDLTPEAVLKAAEDSADPEA